MRWLRALLLGVLALVGAGLAVRVLAPLPSLENRTASRAYADTGDTALGRAIAPAVAAAPAGHSGIHPLADPAGAFAARILLARAAESSIDAQYYIWHADLTGTLLFDELRAAAERGVRVRLLLDDNNTVGLDPVLAALDAHPNIEVRLFNPFTIRAPRLIGFLTDFSRLNRRMHNKSFTVDNQATIVGGRNIGDEYFGAGDGALFADLDVLGVGPVVADVSADFDSYWASLSSYPADRIVPASGGPTEIAARAADAARDPGARPYLEAVRDSPFVRQLVERAIVMEWAPTRMISDDPAKGLGRAAPEQLLVAKLKDALGEPRRTLGLVSGYFVPAKAGTAAFAAMAGRGVQVTILTNALEATDVPIVHAGYVKWRKKLLAAGVRLYEMRGSAPGSRPRRHASGVGGSGSKLSGAGSALHAKTFAVDGRRVFVGSFNFDPRSAHLNTELGFVIESPALAERMQAAFERSAPARTYEVRLSPEGEIYWIERRDGREIRHATEPGTTRWQRAAVALLSLLPIEWLL
ncbi:phospholipase D family protein [Sphingomonas sp. LY54]|uniref:phospholipase D family protein n=1 Tax=Sphingomonas sp. LY54 TaxID=3095343 RepID=UPI002D7986FA|nr:phospholipase D family protein [Sphingomonas sp. LY54]WRP28393.1 phospholipase D family protein [Sphingomonas sp. LY54]